jgi:Stigma-specific protein, Stig1
VRLSPPTTICSGVCVNPNGDALNCGGCNKQCPASQACCSGGCKDRMTDNLNCGACGDVCPQTCSGTRTTCGGGRCLPAGSYSVFLEEAASRCGIGDIQETAASQSEAITCAQRGYGPTLTGPPLGFSINCPDPTTGSTCIDIESLSISDASTCLGYQGYSNCQQVATCSNVRGARHVQWTPGSSKVH